MSESGPVVRAGVPLRGLCVPCAGAQRRDCVLSVVISLPAEPDALVRSLFGQRWVLARVADPPQGTKFVASVMYCEACARKDVGDALVDAAFEQYRLACLVH